jgi:altronate dehydratase small subunit
MEAADPPHPGATGKTAEGPEPVDRRLILLSPEDNVCVACIELRAGDAIRIDGAVVYLPQDIPLGHKVARRPIEAGETIYKYGASIGTATRAIAPGDHVHLHNLQSDYLPSFGVEGIDSWPGGRGA